MNTPWLWVGICCALAPAAGALLLVVICLVHDLVAGSPEQRAEQGAGR